jgi:ketosteroid isomerase-like protein
MDQEQAKTLAARFIGQLHRVEDGDAAGVDSLVAMFSDDAHLSNPIIGRQGGDRAGREAIAQFWRNYQASFGEIHSEFYDVTASDHSAGLFWRSTGKGAGGQPLDYEGVSLLTFDDNGRISRFKGYFDSEKVTFSAKQPPG